MIPRDDPWGPRGFPGLTAPPNTPGRAEPALWNWPHIWITAQLHPKEAAPFWGALPWGWCQWEMEMWSPAKGKSHPCECPGSHPSAACSSSQTNWMSHNSFSAGTFGFYSPVGLGVIKPIHGKHLRDNVAACGIGLLVQLQLQGWHTQPPQKAPSPTLCGRFPGIYPCLVLVADPGTGLMFKQIYSSESSGG